MDRPLDAQEKALWGRVMASVKPLHPAPQSVVKSPSKVISARQSPVIIGKVTSPHKPQIRQTGKETKQTIGAKMATLDGSWDRAIGKGVIIPDVSIDLHGQGLSHAYARLDGALEQAIAHGARVILLVTGKARSHDRTSGEGRGAIASVVHDWLAASRHARWIAAVRGAHPRHGGAGALYIVLKR